MIYIPEPTLRASENATPYRSARAQKMGKGRVFFDVVVVKGTFDLGRGSGSGAGSGLGSLAVAERQADVVLSDRYHDGADPSCSSLAWPGDLVVGKVTTDLVVTGTARAPRGKPVDRWTCSVSASRGGVALAELALVATGPRAFTKKALRGFRLEEPAPTTAVPIRYELAYGGAYPNPAGDPELPFLVDRANPSGRGFFDPAALDPAKSYDGPQWETPGAPVTSINEPSPLAGFGPVARMWSARTAYGGTYDAAWEARLRADREQGIPGDYPADFDLRFFQCAHPALIAKGELRGGDVIRLVGLASTEDLAFELPPPPRGSSLSRRADWIHEPFRLDLVHVDLDQAKVFLTWRMSLAAEREILAVVAATGDDEA